MTPIPLSSPDGTVYAYACGVCHHIGGAGSLLVRGDPGWQAEDSLLDAEECCTCLARLGGCGRRIAETEGRAISCQDCDAKRFAKWDEVRRNQEVQSAAAPKLPDDPQARRLAEALERWGVDSDDIYEAGLEILALLGQGVRE